MNRPLASAVFALGACTAQAGEQDAYVGLAADAATTSAALAVPGIGEANPLGWATIPLRLALIHHANTLPREQAQPVYDAAQAGGWGAAANNILVLAGVGGAAPLVGFAIGYIVWRAGEREREFWRICGVYKTRSPDVSCSYEAWHADDVMRLAMEQRAALHH